MAFADQTPGGHSWRHACILRIELVRGRDTHTIKLPGEEKPIPVGHTIYGKVRKNQVGAEGRQAMWWFYYCWTPENGFGIDRVDEISRLSIMTRTVKLSGGWYYHSAMPKEKVHGLPNFLELVKTDEAFRATLTKEVLDSIKDHVSEVAPMTDPEAPIEEMPEMVRMWAGGRSIPDA